MTTIIYLSNGYIYNDTHPSVESAMRAFDREFGSTIVDVIDGTVTGREMRRIAKSYRAKLAS